ncbi:PCMD domain-containing protein [Sphingobacterium sp. UT-1RO-CII-1]|uniref:PCMD domain-containing protein n=1 Tax=Sphingobacterium sp. UT-1RO-CII-1 TaxID=2995225 RepID=UPI00227BFD56|nr:PCMD domain-containing protein [Sphingobacterium sp. UT-1RO-CII-1]MCY4781394.1 PCMD domain-containing protein [Sphingobacterium sp. UT-1RO-CII-1]
MEADIVAVHDVEDSFLMNPVLTNNKVVVYVKPGERDLTNYQLKFDLTKGATISPSSESIQDYNNDVIFTVTSEDGRFSKKYTVTVIETNQSSVPNEFLFQDFRVEESGIGTSYYQFFDVVYGQNFDNWGSGNYGFGFSFLGQEVNPEQHPTGVIKNSITEKTNLLLETKKTGPWGVMFGAKAPMAAGNLFLGSFNLKDVMKPLTATEFGRPFNRMPVSLEGSFNYKAGDELVERDASGTVLIPAIGVDSCDIYAVFYNRKELVARQVDVKNPVDYLDGYTIHNDESIVAVARLNDGSSTAGEGFIDFKVPFVFRKEVNENDLYAMDYNIAIVITSSKYGDQFKGAIGSKLIVDRIKINTK